MTVPRYDRGEHRGEPEVSGRVQTEHDPEEVGRGEQENWEAKRPREEPTAKGAGGQETKKSKKDHIAREE